MSLLCLDPVAMSAYVKTPLLAHHPLTASFETRIFIPSKGRAELRRKATWHELMEDGIPFTLVVEEQEAALYAAAIAAFMAKKGITKNIGTIETLDERDQGVSYVRNHILHKLAPAKGFFWVMDDDIQRFYLGVEGERRNVRVTPRVCLTEAYRRMNLARNLNVAVFALDYQQFSWMYDNDQIALNGYCNIAVCMTKERLPAGIRFRFRVREDYDFVLQCVRGGAYTMRFRNVSFAAPSMGQLAGGMQTYYEEQKPDIRLQNRLFLQAWGHLAAEAQKGNDVSRRWDVRVNWRRLGNYKTCRAVAQDTKWNGKFFTDPLKTPLLSSKVVTALMAANKAPRPPPKRQRKKKVVESESDEDSGDEDSSDSDEEESEEDSDDELLVAKVMTKTQIAKAEAAVRRAAREEAKAAAARPLAQCTACKGRFLDLPRHKLFCNRAPKPAKRERSPVRPGWVGWTTEEFRVVGPELAQSAGLKDIEKYRPGIDVCYVPGELTKPPLMAATVIEVSKKKAGDAYTYQLKVAPHNRAEPMTFTDVAYHYDAKVFAAAKRIIGAALDAADASSK
jgi:hypothetical protein